MKKLLTYLVVIVIFCSHSTLSLSQTNNRVLLGMGAQSCKVINELGEQGILAAYSWMQGYMSAMSAFEGSTFDGNTRKYFIGNQVRNIKLWRDFCRDFPHDSWFNLVFSMYKDFGGTRQNR